MNLNYEKPTDNPVTKRVGSNPTQKLKWFFAQKLYIQQAQAQAHDPRARAGGFNPQAYTHVGPPPFTNLGCPLGPSHSAKIQYINSSHSPHTSYVGQSVYGKFIPSFLKYTI